VVTGRFETRRATEADAPAIASAHADSIRSLGSAFYTPEIVEAWGEGLTPDLYVRAMRAGEAFFVATGLVEGTEVVLGFSTHRVDDDQDGASVYVRGGASRQGIGSALLRMAEQHAREHGAKSIHIQASLAGTEFYRANGFEVLGPGNAVLMSGRAMPCVHMRKELQRKKFGA
jgi:putative acetyltransferase